MMFRSFVRPLSLALSLAFVTASAAPAFADPGNADKVTEHRDHGKGKDKSDKKRPRIEKPIDATKFSARVATRIAKAKERLTEAMKTKGVAEATRTAALKEFDTAAVAVQNSATAAAKDGTVTADEAKQVRAAAQAMRKQMKEKFAPNAGKKGERGHKKGGDKGGEKGKSTPKEV